MPIYYGTERLLTKQKYSELQCQAKKMKADIIQLKYIWHEVRFGHASVSFIFKPLQYKLSVTNNGLIGTIDFKTKEDAAKITADMHKALKFAEFLEEFEKTL